LGIGPGRWCYSRSKYRERQREMQGVMGWAGIAGTRFEERPSQYIKKERQ